ALVLNWQKKLGYHNDPFQDKPFFTECLVGLDKQREAINLFIIKGQQLGLVLGEKGMGKSTLVHWLQEEMQGKIKVIALEAKTIGSRERLEKTLYEATSNFIEKHIIKDEKTKEEKHTALKERLKAQHVLFIDNAGSLTPPHISLLQEFLNDTKLQLLLFDLP
ncbi:AAA family ATPase, partial [Candidatus Woesearchaeota archaeon]|nr:AAA family ATPase [Candidatus Woesearchaeota archaeon]